MCASASPLISTGESVCAQGLFFLSSSLSLSLVLSGFSLFFFLSPPLLLLSVFSPPVFFHLCSLPSFLSFHSSLFSSPLHSPFSSPLISSFRPALASLSQF